ncbi:hypothetical protein TB1_009216 [Malus domestica]
MLLVMSCFRQVNVFLVIKTIGQSKLEDAWVLLSVILGLQCIIDVSSNKDHCSSFLSFIYEGGVGRCLDGGSNTLYSKIEFHILNPLQVVSSIYVQSGEIELVQVRHVPKTKGTTKCC